MTAYEILVYLTIIFAAFAQNKIKYMSTEHPEVTWYNPKYTRYVNLTAQRYGRSDPFYYVGFHVDLIWPIYSNVNIDFYFYELLSNQYKRSFVEFHFEVCDMITSNRFLGIPLNKYFPPCPYQAGPYHIFNLTIPLVNIPSNFPFTKGRIQANFSSKDNKEFMGFGHIDMELKEVSARYRKKQKNLST